MVDEDPLSEFRPAPPPPMPDRDQWPEVQPEPRPSTTPPERARPEGYARPECQFPTCGAPDDRCYREDRCHHPAQQIPDLRGELGEVED